MSLGMIGLLQAAFAVLNLTQANPSLPQVGRENAMQLAQASGSFSASPISGVAPLTVTFSGSSGQGVPGRSSTVAVWIDFGDGIVDDSLGADRFTKSHTYISPGVYTAKLFWKLFGHATSNFPTNTVGTLTVTVTN
jgi:PKD repeat protein